ncbi:carbohydrate ABC transporter permease [Desertihabitans brevis]|uniref:carbohydrate ABC transporter permease n=1 Tax=Desertihabitans brevis TaxID=2268447 RepID=UPI001F40448F|nr:sugar ABC transporter permease [Desertihabitans brevis]
MSASEVRTPPVLRTATSASRRGASYRDRVYPLWFYVVPAVLYLVLFIVPTVSSFYFAFTRWDLREAEWIGWANFARFFAEPSLVQGLWHTLVYAVITSGAKVVLGLPLAVLLTSGIIGRTFLRSVLFFPVLVSTIGVGITFTALMDDEGLINSVLALFGIDGVLWLADPALALYSVALVDIWKGIGLATLIYIAGILAIPHEYFEAARVDGAGRLQQFFTIILPLSRPATATVIILSLIGGLRSFDLIWAMTRGGPGFASDVIASVIYKQYQAGFYGLSTAGNVVLFLVVTAIALPLNWFLTRREVDL